VKFSQGDNATVDDATVIELFDKVFLASERIRVIEGPDKGTDIETIERAKKFILAAKRVFILGYGFDVNNSERIGLRYLRVDEDKRRISFTNFEDSNRVNKLASKLLLGESDTLLVGRAPIIRKTDLAYVEKSVRTVYNALAYDFESI
jgi:hypothetical protein